MMTTPVAKILGFGLTVDNVNEALPLGLQLVKEHGIERVSRGITVLEVPGPVSTIYRNPQRRVLFDEHRDANPFFHLIDALWLLSGSNRVDLPSYFLTASPGSATTGLPSTVPTAIAYVWRTGTTNSRPSSS